MFQYLPAALTLFGSAMSASGSYAAGSAARRAGERQKAAADFQAAQLDQNANTSIAVSQRKAQETMRQTKLVQSRALAVAAASGGGASDPTIVRIIGRIAAEGAYREALDLYEGEDRARQMRLAAEGKRYEGDIAMESGAAKESAYQTSGTASLFAGAGSLFSKYGMGGYTGGSTSPIDSNGINWDNV
jgi:hypothetical protein